jgi:hypothetical protein
MEAWRKLYGAWSMAIEQLVDAGDDVLAIVTQRGRLGGSRAEV